MILFFHVVFAVICSIVFVCIIWQVFFAVVVLSLSLGLLVGADNIFLFVLSITGIFGGIIVCKIFLYHLFRAIRDHVDPVGPHNCDRIKYGMMSDGKGGTIGTIRYIRD